MHCKLVCSNKRKMDAISEPISYIYVCVCMCIFWLPVSNYVGEARAPVIMNNMVLFQENVINLHSEYFMLHLHCVCVFVFLLMLLFCVA